eukprot:100668_1
MQIVYEHHVGMQNTMQYEGNNYQGYNYCGGNGMNVKRNVKGNVNKEHGMMRRRRKGMSECNIRGDTAMNRDGMNWKGGLKASHAVPMNTDNRRNYYNAQCRNVQCGNEMVRLPVIPLPAAKEPFIYNRHPRLNENFDDATSNNKPY